MVKLSVLVVNVKGKHHLPRLLTSLRGSTFRNFEVVIVDDSDMIRHQDIDNITVRIIKIGKDQGLAYCRNLAVEHSTGEILLFLDNDTEVIPNSLEFLVNYLEENRNEIVQLFLVTPEGEIDSLGGIIDDLGYPKELGKNLNEELANKLNVNKLLYGKGAAIAMRRDVFYRVGGFDTKFFYGYDETDFCFRAVRLGYPIKLLRTAKVIHYEHGSFSKVSVERKARITFFLESRRLYFVHKNFTKGFLFRKSPSIWFYFIGSVVKDLTSRKDPILFKSRVKALLWFVYCIPDIVKMRILQRKINFIYDEEDLIRLGLITERS
ncbi:putative glycosyltransferase [Metallosphaera yellowstonensis MK1]|jgi:GT2 family glycosyltransferase|uniref:Putative glycosyltransferase n=1 Tax=Metallosphaera yellowstonensis MK1 TaxID=671065 RepID=H2C0J8_9CREN|nr:putative glycosyltransferase [Metallosphaera yellowstonensis MK1]